MALPAPIHKLIAASRRWAYARAKCRAVSDSKSAKPKDLEEAKKLLAVASDELFNAVQQFELFLRRESAKPRTKVNWGAVFGAIAEGAKFIEQMAPKKHPEIIDTTGETTF